MKYSKLTLALLLSTISITGCSSTEVIVPKKIEVPAAVEIENLDSKKYADRLKAMASSLPESYKALRFEELDWKSPKAENFRSKLSQNATLYTVEDKSLPWVHFKMIFEEQGADHSAIGSSVLLSTMLTKGGITGEFTPQQLTDSLEMAAASLSVSAGDNYSSLNISCMPNQLDALLDLGIKMIKNPSLDSSELTRAQQRTLNSIKHRYDRPGGISRQLFNKVMYGTHNKAWRVSPEEINSVNTQSLKKYLNTRFDNKKIVIGISGDFDKASISDQLKKITSDWKPAKKGSFDTLSANVVAKPGVWIVDKKSTQTHIRMAQPFVKRPHPDYYKVSLASWILGGGGFGTRLVNKIRTQEGLAYSVGAFGQSSYRHQTGSGVVLQTKSESAIKALGLVFSEIDKMIKEGPSDAEMTKAKASLVQSLPSLFDKSSSIMGTWVQADLWNRNDNHFEVYPSLIDKITKEDVVSMLKKYFTPEQMSVTLVGPKASILEQDKKGILTQLGGLVEFSLEDIEKRSLPKIEKKLN
jgi:zinc protease